VIDYNTIMCAKDDKICWVKKILGNTFVAATCR